MAWLRQLFSRKSPAREAILLPGDLHDAIVAGRFNRILPVLQPWCIANRPVDFSRAFASLVESLGWSTREVEKLEILVEYFGGDPAQAFERARPFIAGDLFDPDLFMMCLSALYNGHQFDDAYRILRGVQEAPLAQRPDYWFVRALVCSAVNRMADLKLATDRACELAPDDQTILENALEAYRELNDTPAWTRVRQTLGCRAGYHGYEYALDTLAHGDYEEGFRQMESRYDMPGAERFFNSALLNMPRWSGQPLTREVLLVSSEQGVGDCIQMARYLRQVQSVAPRMVVEARQETISLLEASFPGMCFVPWINGQRPAVDFDFWIGMMSLPYIFGSRCENIPMRSGYLRPTAEATQYWRHRVDELAPRRLLRIGIAWSGQVSHRADRRRSIPATRMMDATRSFAADYFALQTEVPSMCPEGVHNLADELVTFADTAALIQCMDLVISVDTSAVHLAGALGKETWLLLPYRYEWRWGLEGESNHWYDSVRVLRQNKLGDWDGLLDYVFNQRLPERGRSQRSA